VGESRLAVLVRRKAWLRPILNATDLRPPIVRVRAWLSMSPVDRAMARGFFETLVRAAHMAWMLMLPRSRARGTSTGLRCSSS